MSEGGWDEYWQLSQSAPSFEGEGISHPVLDKFWDTNLKDVQPGDLVVDLGSGRGEVSRRVLQGTLISVDISTAALSSQKLLYHQVVPVVADISNLPFRPDSLSVIVSQFGAEYGGIDVVKNLGNLLGESGHLYLIMHRAGSVIEEVSRDNLEALQLMVQCEYIPCAVNMFRENYAAMKGEGDEQAVQEANGSFVDAFHQVGEILARYGDDVAGGTVKVLYEEVARIQSRIQQHVEKDVLDWLQELSIENEKHMARMSSMLSAAISDEDFLSLKKHYQSQGFDVTARPLNNDQGYSLGWGFSARC